MIHHFSFQGKLNYKDYQKTNNKIRERNANIRSRIRYGRHFGITKNVAVNEHFNICIKFHGIDSSAYNCWIKKYMHILISDRCDRLPSKSLYLFILLPIDCVLRIAKRTRANFLRNNLYKFYLHK